MVRRAQKPREQLSVIGSGSATQRLVLRTLDVVVMPVWAFGRDRFIGAIERRNGISTAGIVSLDELGIAAPDRSPYSPAPWSALRRAVPPEWVRPDDVFLDLGSGMGRVVYQAAARYRFRRVIGVELARDLHRVAESNLGRNRDRLTCSDVRLVNADVLDYTVPDDVTMVFLFNPFTGHLFGQAIDRLLASLDRNPRWLRLIYVCPAEHDHLMATGRARLIKKIRRPRPVKSWAARASIHLYDLLPMAAQPSGAPASTMANATRAQAVGEGLADE